MEDAPKVKRGFFSWFNPLKDNADKILGVVGLGLGAKHLFDAARGKEVPDSAHPALQALSKGGKDSWVDEARMTSIKLNNLTKNERRILRGLDAFVAAEYGDGFFGSMMENRYGNKLRPGLLHLTTPDKDVTDEIPRQVGNKIAHDKIVRTIPGSDDDLVKYLKYLVREVRSATKTATGSEEEKKAAGYRHALSILKGDGFPDLQFAEFAKIADAAIEAFPDVAKAAARKVSGVTAEVTRTVAAHSPRVKAAIKADALLINQAVIDRSDRIDARGKLHPLRFFGW